MNETVCVGCTESTLVVRIVGHSFVCLLCVMPVSIHNRLCVVTVRMKVSDFQRGQIAGARVVGASVTKTAIFFRCFQSSSFQSYEGEHKSMDDVIS